jgi:DNA-binding response OmpR family regulator
LKGIAPGLRFILIVDGNEDDVFVMQNAFERAGLKNRMLRISTGRDCVKYLSGVAPYDDREGFPLPSVVLLDVKLPGMDGFDVLRWLRHQPALAKLCVVMLSSRDDVREMRLALELGANCFLKKPTDIFDSAELLESVMLLLPRC